jgi:hypothetical protein
VHHHGHVGRPILDDRCDQVSVLADELGRVLAALSDDVLVLGVAQHRQRHLVDLEVAATGGVQIGDLLTVNCGDVGQVGHSTGGRRPGSTDGGRARRRRSPRGPRRRRRVAASGWRAKGGRYRAAVDGNGNPTVQLFDAQGNVIWSAP